MDVIPPDSFQNEASCVNDEPISKDDIYTMSETELFNFLSKHDSLAMNTD